MVFLGVSRGCETCKRRRKRCDLSRPSCMRCVAAHRTCGGYEVANDPAIFRNNAPTLASASLSIARKCSLPANDSPLPGSIVSDEESPKEVSQNTVHDFALRAFFYDYCITSQSLQSRGLLARLETLVLNYGRESNAAKGCRLVAFTVQGRILQRARLIYKSQELYHYLVGALSRHLATDRVSARKDESTIVAMLLGLYEVSS